MRLNSQLSSIFDFDYLVPMIYIRTEVTQCVTNVYGMLQAQSAIHILGFVPVKSPLFRKYFSGLHVWNRPSSRHISKTLFSKNNSNMLVALKLSIDKFCNSFLGGVLSLTCKAFDYVFTLILCFFSGSGFYSGLRAFSEFQISNIGSGRKL